MFDHDVLKCKSQTFFFNPRTKTMEIKDERVAGSSLLMSPPL